MKRAMLLGLLTCLTWTANPASAATPQQSGPLRSLGARLRDRVSDAAGFMIGRSKADRIVARAAPSVRALLTKPFREDDHVSVALRGFDRAVWGRLESGDPTGKSAEFRHPVRAGEGAGRLELDIWTAANSNTGIQAVGFETSMAPHKYSYLTPHEMFYVSLHPVNGGTTITPAMESDLNARVSVARALTTRDLRGVKFYGDSAFDSEYRRDYAPLKFAFELTPNRGGTNLLYIRNQEHAHGKRSGDVFLGHLLDVMEMSPAKLERVRKSLPTQ